MKKRSIGSFVCVFMLMLLLVSCGQVSLTGRRQFNLVPASVMQSMSLDAYQQFLSTAKLSSNAAQTAMVKRCGQRISAAVESYLAAQGSEATFEWEFNLVQDDSVNAWAMPGGKIVVYSGLLPVTRTEAGLAVVMGHEIAHVVAKHGAERMTQGLLANLGGMALSVALKEKSEETQALFMTAYGMGAQVGVLLPFSRLHENEADYLGLIFMAMAGYDPNEAVTFWEAMAAANSGGSQPEFLSTHPVYETRITNMKEKLPDAMTYYQKP